LTATDIEAFYAACLASGRRDGKGGLRFKSPKTKRSRRKITLPACFVEEVRVHKREHSEQRLALGLGKDESDLVFTTWDGQPRSPRAFTKDFSRTIAVAKVSHVTFHALRHNHITDLLARGLSVNVCSAPVSFRTDQGLA
jgi:integrase